MCDGHQKVIVKGEGLTIDDVYNVARNRYIVEIPDNVKEKINKFREGLEEVIKKNLENPYYGITTGCGDLKDTRLKPNEWQEWENTRSDQDFRKYMNALEDYQERYIKAHNCGTGNPLPEDVVRAAMVIRLNSFAKGLSGVTLDLVEILANLLNEGVTPWVLEEGSVGASGDLVPLAMVGATIMGLDGAKAYYKGKLLDAKDALLQAGLTPLRLKAKEAMALTNGANFIAAIAALSIKDVENLLENANIGLALSLEAISGETDAFSEFIINARPHEGTKIVAEKVRELIENSELMTLDAQRKRAKSDDYYRVQDRYSFRCAPHVHGAAYEALWKLRKIVEIEINSATDNPLIEEKSGNYRIYSGGNFHGQPLAVAIDYMKIALTGLSGISERRIFSLLDKNLNFGLPADLAIDPKGGDTGLMLAQYAAAARVAENKVLSTPSSVMSIPTSANQEDFVSMGMNGALHLRKIIHNTQVVIAIELLTALRALQIIRCDFKFKTKCNKNDGGESLKGLKIGKGTEKVYEYLNKKLPKPDKDEYLRTSIEKLIEIIRNGELIKIHNV